VFQWFRLADAGEGLGGRFLNEAKDAQRFLAILLNPPREIVERSVSNSKLLSDFVNREASQAILGFEETFAHRVTLEKVRGLSLGFDLAPDFDWDDHCHGVAALIGDILDQGIGGHLCESSRRGRQA
jgi:hypothetical protein